MKILLLGEFSGFFTDLRKGLRELGHEVDLASNGDMWKKIEGADFEVYHLDSNDNKLKKLYDRCIEPVLHSDRFYGYDVVHCVHGELFQTEINSLMMKRIKENNGAFYVSVCGSSKTLYDSWKDGLLEYYTYDDNPEKCFKYESGDYKSRLSRKTEQYVNSIADGIIPINYEYNLGVKDLPNCCKMIKLPIDATKVTYEENVVGDKIMFYHGIIKPKDKGTNYIKEAFDIIRTKYPNDVEMVVADRLPFKEYLEVLKKTNVLVDACKEHLYGLNAGYGLAEGKVVMGPATKASLDAFGIEKCPVVPIVPDVKQIVSQIEYIIENRSKITEWGKWGREYVETVHNPVAIAQEYIGLWSNQKKK